MNFLVKRILKTFLTILVTSLVLLLLIFGGVKLWQWLSNSDFIGDNVDVIDPIKDDDDDIVIIPEPDDDDIIMPDGKGDPDIKDDIAQTLPVKVIEAKIPTAQPTEFTDTTTKTGIITAEQTVSVYPETTAILQNLKIKEGQKIEAGTLIATIGNSLQLELTKVNYNSALKSLQLAEESLRVTQINNNVTESTFENQLQSTRLNLRQAIQQLENSYLVSFQQDVVSELTKKVQAETAKEQAEAMADTNTNESDDTDDTDNTDQETDEDNDELTELEKQQKLLELHQQNLQRSQTRGQNLQSHYQIMNAQNQLNLLLKQLEGQKLQGKLQEINAISQINQIRQQLETAKVNLDASKIVSPVSGVITKVNADPGERVTPNEAILTITNFNSIIVQVNLTPEELFQLDPEAEAVIKLFDQEIPAEIVFTSPIADAQTRTIAVKVAPKNDTKLPLIPNTFAKVTFKNPEPEQDNKVGFIYPLGLIKFRDRTAFVPVVVNNRVQYKKVKIGSINNGTALITNGIKTGDQVIIHPRLLPENLPVKISK